MNNFLSRIKKRYWDEDFETFNTPHVVGGFIVAPLPRRFTKALMRHWLAHWKFWITTLIGCAGVYLAVLELAK
jgi:hypothetical protein